MEKWRSELTKGLKNALTDADLDYARLGGGVQAQTWRNRIKDPGKMQIEDLVYLIQRTRVSPPDFREDYLDRFFMAIPKKG